MRGSDRERKENSLSQKFFDPIQQQAFITRLRTELEILATQADILREVQMRNGVDVDMRETTRLIAQLESKIALLESRYTTVN
jgi:hypothetical protein